MVYHNKVVCIMQYYKEVASVMQYHKEVACVMQYYKEVASVMQYHKEVACIMRCLNNDAKLLLDFYEVPFYNNNNFIFKCID